MNIRLACIFSAYIILSNSFIFSMENIPTVEELSLDEKIGQLFVVSAVVDEQLAYNCMLQKSYRMDKEYIKTLIIDHKVGGIIFLGKSDVEKQNERTVLFQNMSTIPLTSMPRP